MREEFTISWVVLFMRLVLAAVLITAGFSMIFLATPGEEGQSASFESETFDNWPPDSQLWVMHWAGEEGSPILLLVARAIGFVIPWVLLITGAMILAGFLTRWAGIALGITFIVVLIGILVRDPLAILTSHLLPYFLLLLFILLLERMGNMFSVDALFFRGREREFESGGSWAALFARLALGLIFLFGAYLKLGIVGIDAFVEETFVQGYSGTWLPGFLLPIAGYFDVFVELIGGILLVLGLFTPLAAVVLCFFMLMLVFGHLVASPFFGFMSNVLPYLGVLLLIFFLSMRSANRISLDNLFWGRRLT